MNWRRTSAVTLKVLRTLKRDRRSLALMLIAPIFAMTIFGFVFGTEIANVPVAIVNEDEGDLAADVIAALDPDTVIVTTFPDWDAAQAAVRDGTAHAALRFPANFTAGTQPSGGASGSPGVGGTPVGAQPPTPPTPPAGSTVDVLFDGTNSQEVQAVTRALSEAVQDAVEARGGRAPITVEPTFLYAEDATFMDFFVPGIMAYSSLFFTTILTLMTFVGERSSGTLSRILVTPMKESEIVVGYALAFSLVGVAQGAILLGIALVVFDVLLVGGLALVFLIVALMAVDALTLGILLSAAAKQESQAVQFLPLIVFPTLLLSGIFLPVESLPGWLAPFAWVLPPTYAVEGLRLVMLKGQGLADVWWHLTALAAFAAVFLALSVAGLKRSRAQA